MNETLRLWPDMTRGVLASLLDLAGEPGKMSPRRVLGKAVPLSLDQLAELYAAEVLTEARVSRPALTPAFKAVAETLLAPRVNLTIRLFRPDAMCVESNVQFPGPAFKGRGVALNQIGRCFRIVDGADDSAILSFVAEALPKPQNSGARPEPFEALLDPAQALVLAAIIDLTHVNHRPVRSEQVTERLSARWGRSGFGEMLTYVMVTTGAAAPPDNAQLEAARLGLTALELIAPARDGAVVPGKAARVLVALGHRIASGLQWQRISDEAGECVFSDRLFLFSDSGAAMAISRGTRGRVHFASTTPGDIAAFVANELVTSAVPAAGKFLPPKGRRS